MESDIAKCYAKKQSREDFGETKTTGTAELRLIQPTADTKPITVDSPTLTAALTKPGSIAQFTFNGQPGRLIYVDITSSKLDSRCGVLRLRSLAVNGGDTFILTAQGDTTELQLVRCPLDGTAEDNYYGTITEGWISFVGQLRFMLECQPDDTRKTIVTNKQLGKDAFLTQLGLSDPQEGQTFKGSLEEVKVSGSVRFSTPQQIGLLVDGWGPGLLIIQFSENMQLLTMYGQEDETFRTLAEKWGV